MHLRPFFRAEHPIAMAHRGSRVLWPENTMPAFRGAVDLGFRYLETDLHASRDGVLVCFHDDVLVRTTNGRGRVWEHTWEELARLDAGYRFGRRRGYPFRGTGVGIPSLEELVTTFPDAYLTLDLKQDGIEPLLTETIERHDLWDRVIVGSFSEDRLTTFRRITEGKVATSSGPSEALKVWLAGRRARPVEIAADALQVPVRRRGRRVVDRRTIDAAHGAGLQVHVWTVNAPVQMRRLLDLGVDGIISDRPDLLRRVMEERGDGGPWHG